MATIGVPLKVLHEAEGHIITVETTTGEVILSLSMTSIAHCLRVRDHMCYV